MTNKTYNKKCLNCGTRQIKLMPDHCSTGIWCNKCGMMLDEDSTDLPEELLNEIQLWNDNWSKVSDTLFYVSEGFNLNSLFLAKKISKYHPCLLFIVKEK